MKLETLQQELAIANNNSDLNKANELDFKYLNCKRRSKILIDSNEDAFLEKFDEDLEDPFLER